MASGQPDAHTTWNTLHASTYWDMRLGFAGAAKGAEVQSSILLRDQTRIVVVVGRPAAPSGPKLRILLAVGLPSSRCRGVRCWGPLKHSVGALPCASLLRLMCLPVRRVSGAD